MAPSQDSESVALERATTVAIGMLGSRISGSAQDAAVLLMGYMRESVAGGTQPDTAWRLLYTASARVSNALLERLSEETCIDQQELLQAIALDYAAQRSGL